MRTPERDGSDPSFNFDQISDPSIDTTLALHGVFSQFEERASKRDQVKLAAVYGDYGDKQRVEVAMQHEAVEGEGEPESHLYVSLLHQDKALYPLQQYAGEHWQVYFDQLKEVSAALEHWHHRMNEEEIKWTSDVLSLTEMMDEGDPSDILGMIMRRPGASIDNVDRYTYIQKRTLTYENKLTDTDDSRILFRKFIGDRPIFNTVDGTRSNLEYQIDIRQSGGRMYVYHGYSNGKAELSVQEGPGQLVSPEKDGLQLVAGTLLTEAKARSLLGVMQCIDVKLEERGE